MEREILEKMKQYYEDMKKKSQGDHGILGNVFLYYGYGAIKESNNIWYYLFERPASELPETISVSDEDRKANKIMVLYSDIENRSRITVVSKEKQKEFEETHKVLVNSTERFDPYESYYKEQTNFFEDCITKGQDEAVKSLLARYNK